MDLIFSDTITSMGMKMIAIGMVMIGDDDDKACIMQVKQEKEDEVDLMFADIEPEDEWQDKVRWVTPYFSKALSKCPAVLEKIDLLRWLNKAIGKPVCTKMDDFLEKFPDQSHIHPT